MSVQVAGDDEANACFPEIAVKDILLFSGTVIVTPPQAFSELHGSLERAVGEDQTVARGGIGLTPVAFNPFAEVDKLFRREVDIHEVEGGIFMADAVVQISGSQPFGTLFAGGEEELAELFSPEGRLLVIAPHGVKGDTFFLQYFIKLLAFSQSVDGDGALGIRHVAHLDDHVNLMVFEDFRIDGVNEVDGNALATGNAGRGVVRVADDSDSPWSGGSSLNHGEEKGKKQSNVFHDTRWL